MPIKWLFAEENDEGKEGLTYFLTLLYLHVTEFSSAPRERWFLRG